MQIHTFRLVKLYIVLSTSSDSDFINGPKQHFTPLQKDMRELKNPVPWQGIKGLSCFQCLCCF